MLVVVIHMGNNIQQLLILRLFIVQETILAAMYNAEGLETLLFLQTNRFPVTVSLVQIDYMRALVQKITVSLTPVARVVAFMFALFPSPNFYVAKCSKTALAPANGCVRGELCD